MNIIIKSLAVAGDTYNRFGKNIPSESTEINIEKYFNVKLERVDFIFKKLKSDKKIEIKLIETKPLKVEKIEKIIEKTETPIEIEKTEEFSGPAKRGRKPGVR